MLRSWIWTWPHAQALTYDQICAKVRAQRERILVLLDEVTAALTGMLAPIIREQAVGLAEVRDVFRVAKMGAVAGCRVIEGEVRRNLPVRVLRDNVVIFDGQIDSLKRFKDDVTEVKSGFECGIGVKNYNDIKPGDQIEIDENIEQAATL